MTNTDKGTGNKKIGQAASTGGLIGAIVGGIAFSEIFEGSGSMASWQWGVGIIVGGIAGSIIASVVASGKEAKGSNDPSGSQAATLTGSESDTEKKQ